MNKVDSKMNKVDSKMNKVDFTAAFWNKNTLKKAYKLGYLEEIASQVRRYGTVLKDGSHYSIAKGYYKGEHRRMVIAHQGRNWELKLWNGDVHSVGFKVSK